MSVTDKSIVSKWPEKLKNIMQAGGWNAPYDIATFESNLNQVVLSVITSIDMKDIQLFKTTSPDELQKLLYKRFNEFQTHGSAEHLKRSYATIFIQHTKLTDTKKQEENSATWDGIKTLFFRTLTTLMIAVVILATGYLAKQYNIPLPMLRSL